MFEIIKYDFELTELGQQKIRIDFKYLGNTEKVINVKVSNPIFTDIWHLVGGDIKVQPNCNYWVGTTTNKPFDVKWNMDTYIQFINPTDKSTIESYYAPNSSVDFKKRSLGKSYSKKNVWVIGDSHIDHFFTRNIKDPIFDTPNYILNPVSHAALTINRFCNRDYLKFLSSYPILEKDTIVFMLGEIDCRVSLKRNAKLKNIPLEKHINNVVLKYKSVLHDIQSKYPKCDIMVTNALPTIPDNWVLTDKDRLLGDSNIKDRMYIKDYFDFTLQKHLSPTFKIIDVTQGLMNELGYANPDMLIKDDMHYKFTDIVINTIKNYLNG